MFSARINVKSTDYVNLYFLFMPLEPAGSVEPVHHLGFLLPLQRSHNAGGEETEVSFPQGQQRDHNVTQFRFHQS